MHGRHPFLPVDALIKPEEEEMDHNEYITRVREELREAYRLASNRSKVACASQKEGYDKKVRGVTPEAGDAVLVRKLGIKGKHKIKDKYESEIYIVVAKDPDLPVYTVKRGDGVGKERVLHRNHLLPVTWPLPVEEPPAPAPVPAPNPQPCTLPAADVETISSDSDEESTDEDGGFIVELHTTQEPKIDESLAVSMDRPAATHAEDSLAPVRTLEGTMEAAEEQRISNVSQDGTSSSVVLEQASSELPYQSTVESTQSVQQSLDELTHATTVYQEQSAAPPPTLHESSYQDPYDDAHDATTPMAPRRSRRHCKPVERYGNPVLYSQRASTPAPAASDWSLRVNFLAQLINMYPHLEDQLVACIMQVITTF